MSAVRCQMSVSLDGYVAGPNQSREHPLGEGGMRLHEWAWSRRSSRPGRRPAGRTWRSPAARGPCSRSSPAGMLDELYLHLVPVVLGAGERLLERVGDPTLEPVEVIASPAVTHVRYRVVR